MCLIPFPILPVLGTSWQKGMEVGKQQLGMWSISCRPLKPSVHLFNWALFFFFFYPTETLKKTSLSWFLETSSGFALLSGSWQRLSVSMRLVGLAHDRGRAEHPITTPHDSIRLLPSSFTARPLFMGKWVFCLKINNGEEIPSSVMGTVVSTAPFFLKTLLLWDGVLRICQHFYYKPQPLEVYKRSHLK